MDIRTRANYDHGPNEVFAVLTDPDFVAATVNQMSVGGQSHQVTTRGDHTVVTTRRTLPTDDLPDVAKKFAGPCSSSTRSRTGDRQGRTAPVTGPSRFASTACRWP